MIRPESIKSINFVVAASMAGKWGPPLPSSPRGEASIWLATLDHYTAHLPKYFTLKKSRRWWNNCATRRSGGRAKNALIKLLRSKTVEQSTLSSSLRILAVADGDTAGW